MSLAQRRVEFAAVVDIVSRVEFKSAQDALLLRLAQCHRHAAQLQLNVVHVAKDPMLNAWSKGGQSAVLVLQGSIPLRKEAIAVGTHLAQHIQQSDVPVLWAMQPSMLRNDQSKLTWSGCLMYLIAQAMRINADAVTTSLADDFNSRHAVQANSDEDWESILLKSVTGLTLVYVVVDLEVIEEGILTEYASSISQSLERLTATKRPIIKIVVVNQRRDIKLTVQESYTLNLGKFTRQPPHIAFRGRGPRSIGRGVGFTRY